MTSCAVRALAAAAHEVAAGMSGVSEAGFSRDLSRAAISR